MKLPWKDYPAAIALTMLIVPALCHSATWEDLGDGYRMCIIDARLDAERRDKDLKALGIQPNAITTAHDKTIIVFNPDTDWGLIEQWASRQKEE